MTRLYFMLILCMYILPDVYAQDSLQATIVVIGDAGQLTKGRHPVVSAAKKLIPMNEKTTIIYIGDNLYKTGLPDNSLPTYDIAKAPLDSQIHIAGTSKTKIYFVPGNHDWANGGSNGYQSILRVQSYIDFLSNKNVQMLPRDGCPGPVEVNITDDITLIMMDSQWWIHEYDDKPGIESDCPYKTKAEVLTQLGDILANNSKRLILLAFHHPFRSYGQHGGYFKLKQHIFPFTDLSPNLYIPLPVLGSAYPLTRAVFGTTQDMKHPLYQAMIKDIEGVVKGHKNVIYLSGHEHTLQLIQESGHNFIVSGSGSKTSRVSKSRNTLFASPDNGFVTLQVSKNKNVRTTFYTVNGDSVKNEFSTNLLNFSKDPLEIKDTMRVVEYVFKSDSVVISASDKYKGWNGFKKTFLGSNYRREWNMPVALKMFNLRKEKGGFLIKSLGGGKQTKSLVLIDNKGTEWTLRSVDKDPEKALPQNLRGTVAQRIVQDMISASHPYAPLVIPDLSRALDIITPDPEFFFVPDDPAFVIYQPYFEKTVVMLENREPIQLTEKSKSTNKVLNKLLEDNDHHVDQEKVLTARLLDMLIGDFDRHADQWKWGTDDTGKGKLYFPIPKDRDQAFFNSDGLLLKFLSYKRMRFLQGFKSTIRDINGLNYVARDFDRTFLNNIDEATWSRVTTDFQNALTDDLIRKAAAKLPPAIAVEGSAPIASKLISRRNDLHAKSMKYYRFLSRAVSVVGSNEQEYFHVKSNPAGLQVTVYKKMVNTDSASIMYNRVFDPRHTREIRLYGLNADDKFEIDPDVSSRIKLRFIGGKGNDTFNLKGNVQNFVYDLSTEKNAFLNLRRSNKEFSSDASASVIEYTSTGFQYNVYHFPLIKIGYNPEDQLLVGMGFTLRTFGFRKDPYATEQRLTTLYAPRFGAYQVKYEGVFNRVIFKNDIVLNASFVNPTLNNFFGYGNTSVYNKINPKEFYRTRYKFIETDLLIRKRYNDIFHFSIGPTYNRYWSRFSDNKNRILSNPAVIGRDSGNIYSIKQYFGGKVKFDISYINNELFPTRGITWFTEFTGLRGFNDSTHALSKLGSDMTIYASISDLSKVMAVFRFGGGHIFSKNFEYFQGFNLGANNFMRGFRKNRFTGSSMAYGSAEFRLKLFSSQNYLLPGDVGILGFYDIGRVWLKNENSNKWHSSVGGGLYYVPYSLIMVSATIGISDEDKLFNFTLGTKFNLTF